jgi:hypothetical protein
MACFEHNSALMAEVAGDIARADVRLADCAMALALQEPEALRHNISGAEDYAAGGSRLTERPHAWGFGSSHN